MKFTKKMYRQYLNKEYEFSIDKRGTLRGATKRLYGDYLYSADKEMFDICYKEYLIKNGFDDNGYPVSGGQN